MRFLIGTLAAVLGLSVALSADTTVPPEARTQYDKGEVAREEGRLEEAAALYKQAIEAHPLYWQAHAGFLACMRGMGTYGPASGLYDKLVAAHPDSVDLKVYKAAAQYSGEALAALTDLSAKHPDNQRVWLELGRVQLVAGELKDAEKSIKQALKIESASVLGHMLMGDFHMRDEKYVRARKEYEDALEIEPGNVAAQLRMAYAWHKFGKPEEGLEILGKLVSENNLPNLVAGHWMLAIIRTEQGSYEDALKSIDKVLTIDKDDFRATMARGYLFLAMDKPSEAAEVFAKAAEADPRSGEALFALGWAHEKASDLGGQQDAQVKERLARAADAYEKCAASDPGVRPRDSLGFVYLMSGKHQEAVTQLKRAKDIDPQFAPAHNNLGFASDLADNRSEAKKRYEMVIDKIDKNNVRARVMLALDLWLDGSSKGAIKELEKALKVNPKDDLAWTFLGDIHYDGGSPGDVSKAIKAYEEAVSLNDKNFWAWYHMGIAYEDDKRKYDEAERCYEKAYQARLNPPVDLLLRLAILNDLETLNRPDKSLQYYQAYVDAGGLEDWVPDRITELKELLAGG